MSDEWFTFFVGIFVGAVLSLSVFLTIDTNRMVAECAAKGATLVKGQCYKLEAVK